MTLKKTPLYEQHVAMGASMVAFKNTMLPVRFSSEIEEHAAVRATMGVFDVSHMGEFIVSGINARNFLQHLLTNDIDKLAVGQAHYTLMLNDDAGIIDDLIVYRLFADTYLLCVNAGNIERDWQHVSAQAALAEPCEIRNASHDYAQLALQGPKSAELISKLSSERAPSKFNIASMRCANIDVLVARTGYSGADGFEIFVDNASAPNLYDALFEVGRPLGLVACGLAARDSLRLEAGLLLHSQDMDESTTPREVGLMFAVDMKKAHFVGKTRLATKMPTRKLLGFRLLDRGLARHDFQVFNDEKNAIGAVTSATYLADKKLSIGFALIKHDEAYLGRAIHIDIRGRLSRAELCSTRFLTILSS